MDFSFSGLKTHVLTTWQAIRADETQKADVARAFEEAVVDTLLIKCLRALKKTGYSTLVVAGGVGANVRLRETLDRAGREQGINVYYPSPE